MPRHDADLSDDAKQELAAIFADMRRQFDRRYDTGMNRDGRPAWLNSFDRPHTFRRGW